MNIIDSDVDVYNILGFHDRFLSNCINQCVGKGESEYKIHFKIQDIYLDYVLFDVVKLY